MAILCENNSRNINSTEGRINMVQIDHTLDAQGLSCPMPIVKLNAEIKKIEVGNARI